MRIKHLSRYFWRKKIQINPLWKKIAQKISD